MLVETWVKCSGCVGKIYTYLYTYVVEMCLIFHSNAFFHNCLEIPCHVKRCDVEIAQSLTGSCWIVSTIGKIIWFCLTSSLSMYMRLRNLLGCQECFATVVNINLRSFTLSKSPWHLGLTSSKTRLFSPIWGFSSFFFLKVYHINWIKISPFEA